MRNLKEDIAALKVKIAEFKGLGDVVAAVATPIARAMRLECIDHETKQLKVTSPCAKRKARMNKAVPFPQKVT